MKIWAYVIAAALLAGAVGYGIHVVKKANRAEAAEAQAKAAEARAAKAEQETIDTAKRFLKAAEADQATQTELAGIRSEMASGSLLFAQALKSRPITRETTHVENGQTVTCRERDPTRYLELFNAAVEGTPVTSP